MRLNSGKPKVHNTEYAPGLGTGMHKVDKDILGTSTGADLTTAQGLFGETTRDLTNTGRVADDNGINSAANKDTTDDAPLWYPQRAMVYEAE